MLTVKDLTSDFQLPLHNEAAFEKIREAKDYASTQALAAGAAALATGGIIHPAGWVLFGLAYKPLVVTQKLARLEKLGTLLFDEFKSLDVQVFPVIPVEDNNPIDLFIRFPRTTHLFISIRCLLDFHEQLTCLSPFAQKEIEKLSTTKLERFYKSSAKTKMD